MSQPFPPQYGTANPYASPVLQDPRVMPAYPQPPVSAGVWRQGRVLVMHKKAVLPDICVKSNQPASRKLKRNLSWHHPLIALSIFAGLLIYLILAAVLTQRAKIHIGLSEEWFARRRMRMWIWGLATLAAIPLGILAGMAAEDLMPLMVFFGFLGCIVAAIGLLLSTRMVYPKKIEGDYVWVKGCHPDFVARFPPVA